MLFSNDNVADLINSKFEPAWESVRPVPIVTIDFGNGKVIRRTLHGNVATYACTNEGKVLDVLPGIYEPRTFSSRLVELATLHRYVREGRFGRSGPVNEAKLRKYHRRQAAALAAGQPRGRFETVAGNPGAIIRVESRLELVMQPARRIQARAAVARGEYPKWREVAKFDSPEDLRGWKALAQDTHINETTRRRQIHEQLAKLGPVQPDRMSKWLYREVLHADLDDPYLGLGKILFDSYPFRAEDGQ